MTQRNNIAIEIATGIFTLLLAHVGFGAVLLLISFVTQQIGFYSFQPVALSAVLAIGLVQFFYGIPLALYFRRRRRFNTAKGVVIGMVITALLNGGCFILVLAMLSQSY